MLRKLKTGLVLVLVGAGIFLISQPKVINITPAKTNVQVKNYPALPRQTDVKLIQWVSGLIKYEYDGGDLHYRRIDSNGKYSYGCLQFQRATFESYGHSLGIYGDIYDCDVQKALAYAMIKSNWKNWIHWQTSVMDRGYGYPPES